MASSTAYTKLVDHLKQINTLGQIAGVLHWDRETMMPKSGIEARSEQAALLADMGCQLAQGLLYSAAKEPEVVGELLAAHAPAATEEAVGGYPTWAVRPPSTARTAPVT